jgi:hypothetical protein
MNASEKPAKGKIAEAAAPQATGHQTAQAHGHNGCQAR